MKIISVILFTLFTISFQTFAQNIMATLGTDGLFTLKDASSTFLTLKQSNGYLGLGTAPSEQLEITKNFRMTGTTSGTAGVIFKGTNRFIHNFNPTGGAGFNTFVGINSGNFTMTSLAADNGSYNTGFGDNTLTNLTTGYKNSAYGPYSLYSNTSGSLNAAIGSYSMYFNTTGYNNTAVGPGALFGNTSGYYNVSIGTLSLFSSTTGHSNTAIGHGSMYSNSSGTHNTALGLSSLIINTTGYSNTALGSSSMISNTIGYSNTAVGFGSLYSNTTGLYNSALGVNSLLLNTTGNSNSSLGINSLYNNTSGSYNIAIGYNSGTTLTTGNNNILIGANSQPTSNSVSNQVTVGDNQITSLRCNVTSITSLSDRRDKKNITNLSLGLDFISKLIPRQFNWDKREWYDNSVSDNSKMEEKLTAGFIAQELEEIQHKENAEWLNLVFKNNPDKLEATYGNLLPIMVKAIQELKAENDNLKAEIQTVSVLKDILYRLESRQEELINEIEKLQKDTRGNSTKHTQNQ